MRYAYEFKRDAFGHLGIVLPEQISIFADFIENIAAEEQVDEYIEYTEKVLDGTYDEFEINLNAASVLIKNDVSVVKNNFRIEQPYENTIETDQFIQLLLVWRKKIPEIFRG